MWERIREKLQILADAAKYDVSCSSSGSKRDNISKTLGNTTGMGICHSYTEDGRCVSLLKILLTNVCIYDCAYCISRKSNGDVKRAAFTVEEVVELTINFYRRNYIEGLFLSSGIFKNADYTMERLVRIVRKLRIDHKFNGYVHLKAIPGASEDLIKEAALYADRLSVNIELPSKDSLRVLAPEKNQSDIIKPMRYLHEGIHGHNEERSVIKSTPKFAPAGQSTQMVVGASPENDQFILKASEYLYKNFKLKRVYYSGYVPISTDNRLPVIGTPVPVMRENRLYQADWLTRFYSFSVDELVNEQHPGLDLDIDPKLSWAFRNRHLFPININSCDYEMMLRVPGIGLVSAKKIIEARRFRRLGWEHLKKIGIIISKAKHFIICDSSDRFYSDVNEKIFRERVMNNGKYAQNFSKQLTFFS